MIFALAAVLGVGCQGKDTQPPIDDVPYDSGHADDTSDGHDSTPPPDACDKHANDILCDGGVAITCTGDGDIGSEETCKAPVDGCVEGFGCATCAPTATVLDAAPGSTMATIVVDGVDAAAVPGAARIGMRAIQVEADDGLGVDVTVDGPFALYAWDGTPSDGHLAAGSFPVSLLVDATATGTGHLTARPTGTADCAGTSTTLDLQGVAWHGLSGRTITDDPGFVFADLVDSAHALWVSADPWLFADRAGLTPQVDVVVHKTPAEWAADPTLTDVTGAVETLDLGAADRAAAAVTAWDSDFPTAAGFHNAYDVVLDFNHDGVAGPGDLVDGLGTDPGFLFLADLQSGGPHKVVTTTYTGGSWLGERTYYPADIAIMGELPLVVISHGNGHLYTWYDYLGEHLASYGVIVMAHENNTGPGILTASTTTLTNTDYILEHLDSIDDGAMVGHLDPHRILWIGHSRGGEGVNVAFDRVHDGTYTPSAFTEDDVVAIASIAPTVYYSTDTATPHDRPFFLIAGSADGDVTGGADCSQCQFFRIQQAAEGMSAVSYVHGADHNDFNCCGFEDAKGPDLIGRDEAQAIAKSYFLAWVEAYGLGNRQVLELFQRGFDDLRPPGLEPTDLVALQFHEDPTLGKLVLDDHQDVSDPTVASSGGAITATVHDLAEDLLDDPDYLFSPNVKQPMNGMTQASDEIDLGRGVVYAWGEKEDLAYAVEVPKTMADWSAYEALSFRACQSTRADETLALDGPLDLEVAVKDSAGTEVVVSTLDYASLPSPYPRIGEGMGPGWANEFVTVRIPLDALVAIDPALDLTHVTSVELRVGADHGSPLGRIGQDDLELTVE